MNERETQAAVLRRAIELVERGWVQGAWSLSNKKRSVQWWSPAATCFCMHGAFKRAAMDLDVPTYTHWYKQLKDIRWNDAPGRTQAEVVAELRRVLAEVEAGR